MQSQAHPSSIMRDLVACLQLNQVAWKKQAPYNLKCRKAIGLSGRHFMLIGWGTLCTCLASIVPLTHQLQPKQA